MRIRAVAAQSVRAGVIAVVLVTLVAGTALAKGNGNKPVGGSGTSSLSLVVSTDNNGNGLPNWADTITYNVATTATSGPQVQTSCYQNGVLVLSANAAFYDGNPFAYMDYIKLSTGAWTGGAADCTAVMYYSSRKGTATLATLQFHVDA